MLGSACCWIWYYDLLIGPCVRDLRSWSFFSSRAHNNNNSPRTPFFPAGLAHLPFFISSHCLFSSLHRVFQKLKDLPRRFLASVLFSWLSSLVNPSCIANMNFLTSFDVMCACPDLSTGFLTALLQVSIVMVGLHSYCLPTLIYCDEHDAALVSSLANPSCITNC